MFGAFRRSRAARCQPLPLLWVPLLLTWCQGDSLPEFFETPKAFYIACHRKRRRPGTTCEGFQMGLARVPLGALRLVATALRGRLVQLLFDRFVVDGFFPFGCDGSRVQCPRSAELERRLPGTSKDQTGQKKGARVLSRLATEWLQAGLERAWGHETRNATR